MSSGQVAGQQFGAEARGPQLGMGEKEIVLPLGHMVGEFVAEAKPTRDRRALGITT